MDTEISTAIENRKLIQLEYSNGERIVEPYALGMSSTGKMLLRAYQRQGYSLSSENYGWKLFNLSEIQRLIIIDENFEPRGEYRKGDKALSEIHSEI